MVEHSKINSSKTPHHPHDKGYKELLSNKKTFLTLLKTFVRADWTNTIQEDDLVRVEKSYILQDFTEKEADIVYRVKTTTGNIVFYCLLELQSSVDYLMPFRLLLYMTEFWRDSYNNTSSTEREKATYRLPVIIPAVLYNGASNWTAAKQFKEMLAGYEQFDHPILNFEYILFDINRYDEEDLCAIANLMSSVFVLDRTTKEPMEIIHRLRKLMTGMQKLHPDELHQLIVWFKHVLKPRVSKTLQNKIDEIMDEIKPEEVEAMITNIEITLQEGLRQAQLEGEAAGLLKGEAVGILKGEAAGLVKGKLEIARKLLLRGDTPDEIVEITGLPRADIDKLIGEIQ